MRELKFKQEEERKKKSCADRHNEIFLFVHTALTTNKEEQVSKDEMTEEREGISSFRLQNYFHSELSS
jgi:hypothetical protein